MLEIAEDRIQRAINASEKFEPEVISRKITITRKNNNSTNPSIIMVVPSDLYVDKEELHQKVWRGERLKDGSLLFRPQ
jgi:hypothetical protein